MQAETILFSLLASEVCGSPVSEEIKTAISPEVLDEVFELAKKHDLAHLAGQALSKLGVLGEDETSQKLKKCAVYAVQRYITMQYEYQRICKVLEDAKIPFIPLKGSVIRDWYPEPWMRTSGDIDILIHDEDVASAIDMLSKKLEHRFVKKYFYEYSLFSPNGVHLELHCNTIEKVDSQARESVLKTVWETSVPENGWTYKRVLPDEMFYFYHILHMAKHFAGGGCGIRPFLDLWILNHRMPDNREKRDALIAQGELTRFAAAVENLTEVWFSGREWDAFSQRVSAFVLTGGVYGKGETMIAAKRAQKKTGTTYAYILHRLFLPFEDMQKQYPVLKKHKWLLPFCVVARWFRPFFNGMFGRAVKEFKANTAVTEEEIAYTGELMNLLGL